jgi:hypothetical protein
VPGGGCLETVPSFAPRGLLNGVFLLINARHRYFLWLVSFRQLSAANDLDIAVYMAASPEEPNLSGEQRGMLALLANFPHGLTEELLVLAHGFDRAMIAGLVHEGFATAEREVVTGPGRAVIEVVRIRITDAGRQVLEG